MKTKFSTQKGKQSLADLAYKYAYPIAFAVAILSGYAIVKSFLDGVEELIKYQH